MNMNKFYRYIIFAIVTIIIALALWYFQAIVAYILISAVLSLIGAPIVNILVKLKIGKFYLPKGLCAGITLLIFWGLFITFFWIFIPLIASEAQKLSQIDPKSILNAVNEPLSRFDALVNSLGMSYGEKFSTIELLSKKIESILNIGLFTDLFSSLASTIGNIFIAIFSISFITVFFLKDEFLFGSGIILLVPTQYEMAARRVLSSTKLLLMRYFVGIGGQITGIIILATIGLTFVGIQFKTAMVIALFAGIINVIPYIGPLIGAIFGLILSLASKIQTVLPEQLLPITFYVCLVFIVVHLIDNIVFQPLILSSSVRAHPLEIFLVILIAGHLAGIAGMLVAIPGYTVVRVFAKQFLNNFKVVKKLTEKI